MCGVCICVAALKIWENRALIIKDSCARSHDSLHNNDKWLKHSTKLHHMTCTFRTFSLTLRTGNCKTEPGINILRTFIYIFNLILFFNFLSYIHNRDTDIFWRLDRDSLVCCAVCFFPHNPPTTQNNNNGARGRMPLGLWWKEEEELQLFLTASMMHSVNSLKGIFSTKFYSTRYDDSDLINKPKLFLHHPSLHMTSDHAVTIRW